MKCVLNFLNGNEIRTCDIFEHGGLRAETKQEAKGSRNKKQLATVLRATLHFYFWGKLERETVVSPKGSRFDYYLVVTDIYYWEIFLDYVWANWERL